MAGISREVLDQLGHLLRPLARKIANTVARAVVELADDGKKLQLLQVGVLEGETLDDAEHHQPYGFSSVPLAGAEAVVVFPNGDRSHPLVTTVSDRRYRPTGGQPGQVMQYHYRGAKITMLENGNIVLQPAAGGQVLVHGSGTAQELATKRALTALRTAFGAAVISLGAGGAATLAAACDAALLTLNPLAGPWPEGTSILKGE